MFSAESSNSKKITSETKVDASVQVNPSSRFNLRMKQRVIVRKIKFDEMPRTLNITRLERILKKGSIVNMAKVNSGSKIEKEDAGSSIVKIKKKICTQTGKNLSEEFCRNNYLRFAMDIRSSTSDDYYVFVFNGKAIDLTNRKIKQNKISDFKTSEIVTESQFSEYANEFDISKRKDVVKKLFQSCLDKRLINVKEPKEYVFVFTNDSGHSNNFLVDTFYYPERITVEEFQEVMVELGIPFSKFTIINNKYYDIINLMRLNQKHERFNDTTKRKNVRKLSRSLLTPLSINDFASETFEKSSDIFGMVEMAKNVDLKPKTIESAGNNVASHDSNEHNPPVNNLEDSQTSSNNDPIVDVSSETASDSGSNQNRNVNLEIIFDSHFDRFNVFGILQENNIGKIFFFKHKDNTFYELILYEIKKITGSESELNDVASIFLKNIHNLSDFSINSIKNNEGKEDAEKIRNFMYNLIFLDMNLYYKAISNLCASFKDGENDFLNLFSDFFEPALLSKFEKRIKESEILDQLDTDIYMFKKIRLLHNEESFISSEKFRQLQDMVIQSLPTFKKLISESKNEILETLEFLDQENIGRLKSMICSVFREVISKLIPNVTININFDSNFVNPTNILIQVESEEWKFDDITKGQFELNLDEYLCDDGEGEYGDKAIFVK
jgi:hypothetical protein